MRCTKGELTKDKYPPHRLISTLNNQGNRVVVISNTEVVLSNDIDDVVPNDIEAWKLWSAVL